jgi:hypothetical protein
MSVFRSVSNALTLLFASGIAVGQTPPKPAAQGFVWEDNSLQAFIKAVEQDKPLVVLFGNAPKFRSPEGTNFTNAVRKEFDKPELQELRDRAVFTLGFPEEDEFARRMASHLKLTDYPTISIIAPRTDQLVQTYRMEGFFTAAEILKDLRLALPPARPASEEAAPPVETPPKPGEKVELTAADKKAIQQAVAEYAAAFQKGDLDLVAEITAQPFGYVYQEGFPLARQVGKAKRAILQAMDEQFGKQADSITFGIDDEKIRQPMMKLKSLYILDYETSLGKSVTLRVEAKMANDQTDAWTLVANRPADPSGKWRVWPHRTAGTVSIGTTETWRKNQQKLAANYEVLAGEIKAGKYASRKDAHQAVFVAYSKAMSPVFGAGPIKRFGAPASP